MPQKDQKERKGSKMYLRKFMAEKFPNLKKETDIQVQEIQSIPNQMNPNTHTKSDYN